jgi:hypothetical protein
MFEAGDWVPLIVYWASAAAVINEKAAMRNFMIQQSISPEVMARQRFAIDLCFMRYPLSSNT